MVNNKMLEFAKCAADPVYYMNTYGYVFNAKERQVTQMTCFEYQNDCLRNFHENQNNIILKSRQCLPGDTYVDTPDGPKAIKDFKVGDEVYSYNLLSSEVEIDTVYDAWCSGNRQCVKFKLQDTRNFEAGENHPFYVKDRGWVKAKNLQRGDEIIDANFGFGDINADEDEIKILAYLITDGSTNKQVKFTNNNFKYLGEFEESVSNLFPELSIRKSKKLNGYDYFPHQSHGTSVKSPIMEWCETKDIANKKTEFKLLPKEVFAWNKKSTSKLINRLFAGDGWISIYKKGENSKRLELGIGSPSEEFLQQVKSLLKKFDVKCNIYEIKNMKLQKNRFFKLRITHSKSATRFVKNIGIFDKVTQEHYDICDNYKHNVKDNPIIKKIEKTVVKKCYDISVSENENFFVDGLLTHNTGLSVITAGYVAWRLLFRYDEKILIIANDGAGAVRFLETVKQFIEHTPVWLKPDAIETDNTKKIAFSNNSYAEAKASSPNAGRGDSLTMLVLDETAFIKDDEAIWMGAGMALSATGGKCIMISTPNGTSGLYYKTWRETISGDKSAKEGEDFVGKTVHWTENENSSEGLEYKKDANGNEVPWSPWYEAQCKRLNWDSVQIAQELDLSFEGSKRLAIDAQLVSKYRTKVENDCEKLGYIKFDFMQKEDLHEFARFTLEETNLHIYKQPEEGARYILAADVARGDGMDYSTMQILDAETLEQVAEYREKVGPDLFPFVINAVARMYNTAYVVIEANSFGLGVCFDIRDKFKYPRNRLYFSKNIKDIHVRHYSYKVNEGTEIPGFQTSRKNRVLLVKAIIEHMRENSITLHSKRLMMEFDTFIMNGDKPEHEKGSHDDLIMALGIALYIRDTEFENVTSSTEMTKSMLAAMMLNANPSVGKVLGNNNKRKETPKGGGGLFIFNGNENTDVGGAGTPGATDDDDLSWLLG
jgi:intein/homing endonuclease